MMTHAIARTSARTWVAVVAAVLAPAGVCRAQPQPAQLVTAVTGSAFSLVGAGLRVTVDGRFLDNPGYRPFRITVTPTAPVTADRTLTVELVFRKRQRHERILRVARDIEIPAGSGPIEVVISVPQVTYWDAYDFNVSEDGTLLPSLSRPMLTASQRWVTEREEVETLPRLLVVGSTMPDTSKLAMNLPEAMGFGTSMGMGPSAVPPPMFAPVAPGATPSQAPSLLALPTAVLAAPGDLSENWIDYTSLDVVCLSIDQLAAVAESRPGAFRAILAWTAAGGNLWVYGVEGASDRWQRLSELAALVGLPAGAADQAQQGWTKPDEAQFGEAEAFARRQADLIESQASGMDPMGGLGQPEPDNVAQAVQATREAIRKAFTAPPKPSRTSHFVFRDHGLGQVVALVPADPFPGTQSDWGWVLAATGQERWVWADRHGLSILRTNPDFWNFLIPGVGLAPVTEFRVLITLFVLTIGPANYYLLRRRKRLHLLVLTIPASAALVTVLLFGYAMVADGLGTRVRARSVTHLDQRRGHAACWARLSYYAGVAPSGGLTFSGDVAVLPLEFEPRSQSVWGTVEQTMSWDEDQHFKRGWLASRTPTQYLTLRSRPSKMRLAIDDSRRASDELVIENLLDAPIEQLAVRTADGKYYWATDVDCGDTVRAKRAEASGVMSRLRKCLSDNQPTFPPGMERQSRSGVFGFRSGRRFYNYRGIQSESPTQETSRLERSLEHPEPMLSLNTYVAIVRSSPEVEFGTNSAREEAGFHVILGEW